MEIVSLISQVCIVLGVIGFIIGIILMIIISLIKVVMFKIKGSNETMHINYSYVRSFLLLSLIIFTALTVLGILGLVIKTNINLPGN